MDMTDVLPLKLQSVMELILLKPVIEGLLLIPLFIVCGIVFKFTFDPPVRRKKDSQPDECDSSDQSSSYHDPWYLHRYGDGTPFDDED